MYQQFSGNVLVFQEKGILSTGEERACALLSVWTSYPMECFLLGELHRQLRPRIMLAGEQTGECGCVILDATDSILSVISRSLKYVIFSLPYHCLHV